MARYELLIKPSASRELAKLGTKQDRQRIVAAIRGLADEPRPVGVEKLSGADDMLVVTVIKVDHRRDVYR